jgi:hypothetical protein
MKGSSLSWRDGGLAIGKDLHALKAAHNSKEAREALGKVTVAIEVADGLKRARHAFQDGRAQYDSAEANYRALIEAIQAAEKRLLLDMADVGKLFAPPISPERIPPGEIVAFVCGVLSRLIDPESVKPDDKKEPPSESAAIPPAGEVAGS